MFHGTLSADVPVTCKVAWWLSPLPVPLLLITPWCIGSWREGEVLLLPGFIGEWRGAELCKSLTHTVPVMGTSRTGGVCLEGHTSDFWGQMAGLLLPPERTEIIWAHHCVSECTYSQRSGKSFVASQYKGKEEHGGPMERVLCAKSCWWRRNTQAKDFFSLINILTC